MRSWIEVHDGISVLVRSGEGVVTAVAVHAEAGHDLVEVQCQPTRRPRSIRVTLRALCPAGSELAERARILEASGEPITWLVEWHRRPGVPEDIPIENLQQHTDTTALLVSLSQPLHSALDALESIDAVDRER
jgi:hypothetical protein